MNTARLAMAHIEAVEVPTQGVTKKWEIRPKSGGAPLGYVQWYNAWRRYCYFPVHETIYDGECLEDLSNFCNIETRTRKHDREI